MSTETVNEELAAWETSSQSWSKHRSLISLMFAPLTSALIDAARIGPGQSVTAVKEAVQQAVAVYFENVAMVFPAQPLIVSAQNTNFLDCAGLTPLLRVRCFVATLLSVATSRPRFHLLVTSAPEARKIKRRLDRIDFSNLGSSFPQPAFPA